MWRPGDLSLPERLGSPRWWAWALLLMWCGAAVIFGGYEFAQKSVEAHWVPGDRLWRDPFPQYLGPALWLLWLWACFNLAPAALIVGVVALVRAPVGRWWRTVSLAMVVVGGAVAEFAVGLLTTDAISPGDDFIHDGRLSSLLFSLVGLAVAIGGRRIFRWPTPAGSP